MRATTVRELVVGAGYARVAVLPVDNDFFRLYRLEPLSHLSSPTHPKEHYR